MNDIWVFKVELVGSCEVGLGSGSSLSQGGTGPRIPDRGLVGRSGHQAAKKKMDPPQIMFK